MTSQEGSLKKKKIALEMNPYVYKKTCTRLFKASLLFLTAQICE